jgi:hypothetical protein
MDGLGQKLGFSFVVKSSPHSQANMLKVDAKSMSPTFVYKLQCRHYACCHHALSVITLVFHYDYWCHAECHYVEFHHAECHYAECLQLILFMLGYHYAGCHYAEF